MCFDNEILKPANQCKHTSIETKKVLLKREPLKVTLYSDQHERLRLVLYSHYKPLSGLFLEKIGIASGYVIKGVYTVPSERRKGLAKQLLALSRFYFGKVRHSENLTIEGELWRDSVEGMSVNN